MTSTLFTLCVISSMLSPFGNHGNSSITQDWNLPNDRRFEEKWRLNSTSRFLSCTADFDGDGWSDTARIMESTKSSGIGILVYFGNKKKASDPICVFRSDTGDISEISKEQFEELQSSYRLTYGIRVQKKGKYKTACGKGFFDCGEGEPDHIVLKHAGILFFQFDAGDERCFYWNKKEKKFIVQQMSD